MNTLIPSSLGFIGAIIGAICGAYLTDRFANRPTRVLTQSEGEDLEFESGFYSQSSFTVAKGLSVQSYAKVHDAAIAQWNDSVISYDEILEWLRNSAPGPNGKPTIDRRSAKNPKGTATRLVGHVFDDIGPK